MVKQVSGVGHMTAHLRQLKFHLTSNHTQSVSLVRRSLITNHIRQCSEKNRKFQTNFLSRRFHQKAAISVIRSFCELFVISFGEIFENNYDPSYALLFFKFLWISHFWKHLRHFCWSNLIKVRREKSHRFKFFLVEGLIVALGKVHLIWQGGGMKILKLEAWNFSRPPR